MGSSESLFLSFAFCSGFRLPTVSHSDELGQVRQSNRLPFVAMSAIPIVKVNGSVSEIPGSHPASRRVVTRHGMRANRQSGLLLHEADSAKLLNFGKSTPVLNQFNSSLVPVARRNRPFDAPASAHFDE